MSACTTCEEMKRVSEALAKNSTELQAAAAATASAEREYQRLMTEREALRVEWKKAAMAQRTRFGEPPE